MEQISGLKAPHAGMSSEDWRLGLVTRFETLRKVVDNNIPELWPGLEFELSCMKILNIQGCTLPIIAIILGRAARRQDSGYKSVEEMAICIIYRQFLSEIMGFT